MQQSDKTAINDPVNTISLDNDDLPENFGILHHSSGHIIAPCNSEPQNVLLMEDNFRLSTSFLGPNLDTPPATDPELPWDTDLTVLESMAAIHLPLPAENIVRSSIDTYLMEFNSMFPLFDPQQLTRTVDQWYSSPTQRSRTSWAVLNVVMAISQYCAPGRLDQGNGSFSAGSRVSDCLSKAQSALTELLMGDVEVANLQVVLGLVIVFHATSDAKPAVFLIPTALRLCQVLGIHRSDSEMYRNASYRDALQYRRIFWITYILDREVALRIRQAPIQQDVDINIELPPMAPDEDAAGFVTTSDTDQQGFNVFLAHVQLARIKGYVYDALFSVHAQQQNQGKRAANHQMIRLMLKDWKDRIPLSLTATSLSVTRSFLPYTTTLLCMMYGTVVTCLGLLCQVNAMDFHWVNQLRDYARSITSGQDDPRVPPPQPQGWNALVNECREFISLFISVREREPAFIWYVLLHKAPVEKEGTDKFRTNICPFASSLICLAANSIVNFDNGDSNEGNDRRLKLEAVDVLGEMKRQTNHETLAKVLDTFLELDSQYRLMTTT